MDTDNKRVAVFIDCENIPSSYMEKIYRTVRLYGRVTSIRAFGNIASSNSLAKWKESCIHYGIKVCHQYNVAGAKNGSDIALTIDAMDLMYADKADVFVIVSNDSDFSNLVIRLKEENKQVIIIGNRISDSLLHVCDMAYDLSSSSSLEKMLERSLLSKPQEVSKTLVSLPLPDNSQIAASVTAQTTQASAEIKNTSVINNEDEARYSKILLRTSDDLCYVYAEMLKDNGKKLTLSQLGGIAGRSLKLSYKDFGKSTLKSFLSSYNQYFKISTDKNMVSLVKEPEKQAE